MGISVSCNLTITISKKWLTWTFIVKFLDSSHFVRRRNQFWAGLGSDLVIEETLSEVSKSTGGLTRSNGMT